MERQSIADLFFQWLVRKHHCVCRADDIESSSFLVETATSFERLIRALENDSRFTIFINKKEPRASIIRAVHPNASLCAKFYKKGTCSETSCSNAHICHSMLFYGECQCPSKVNCAKYDHHWKQLTTTYGFGSREAGLLLRNSFLAACLGYITSEGCTNTALYGSCHQLHLCLQYVIGKCSRINCPWNHSISKFNHHKELLVSKGIDTEACRQDNCCILIQPIVGLTSYELILQGKGGVTAEVLSKRLGLQRSVVVASLKRSSHICQAPLPYWKFDMSLFQLCPAFNQNGICTKQSCPHFHVCAKFVYGKCSDQNSCEVSHDVNAKHNTCLFAKFSCQNLLDMAKQDILAVCSLLPCSKYVDTGSCSHIPCYSMHICKGSLNGKCTGAGCKLAHSFDTDHNNTVLKMHKMNECPEEELKRLLLLHLTSGGMKLDYQEAYDDSQVKGLAGPASAKTRSLSQRRSSEVAASKKVDAKGDGTSSVASKNNKKIPTASGSKSGGSYSEVEDNSLPSATNKAASRQSRSPCTRKPKEEGLRSRRTSTSSSSSVVTTHSVERSGVFDSCLLTKITNFLCIRGKAGVTAEVLCQHLRWPQSVVVAGLKRYSHFCQAPVPYWKFDMSLFQLCPAFNRNGKCTKQSCQNFHICVNFIYGKCTACKVSHDITIKHNSSLFSKFGCQSLFGAARRDMLSVSSLQPCSAYMDSGKCKKFCFSIHICRSFLSGECNDRECKRSHSLKKDHNERVLKIHRMTKLTESDLKGLLLMHLTNHEAKMKPTPKEEDVCRISSTADTNANDTLNETNAASKKQEAEDTNGASKSEMPSRNASPSVSTEHSQPSQPEPCDNEDNIPPLDSSGTVQSEIESCSESVLDKAADSLKRCLDLISIENLSSQRLDQIKTETSPHIRPSSCPPISNAAQETSVGEEEQRGGSCSPSQKSDIIKEALTALTKSDSRCSSAFSDLASFASADSDSQLLDMKPLLNPAEASAEEPQDLHDASSIQLSKDNNNSDSAPTQFSCCVSAPKMDDPLPDGLSRIQSPALLNQNLTLVPLPNLACEQKIVHRVSTPPSANNSISTQSDFIDTSRYSWMWHGDVGFFVPYGYAIDEIQQDLIEARYLEFMRGQSAGIVLFEKNGQEYEINFNWMAQINATTGVRRPIMRFQGFYHQRRPRTYFSERMPNVSPQWSPMDTRKPMEAEIVALSFHQDEYRMVAQDFMRTFGMQSAPVIHRIYRVQNIHQWQRFKKMHDEMREKLGENLNEMMLFHGTTDIDFVRCICHQSFDCRMNGVHGTKWGSGAYFARNSSFSHRYTRQMGSKGHRFMFRAVVLTGLYTHGSRDLRRPPPLDPMKPHGALYDSCVDNVHKPSVHVIFNNDQAYPSYLIEYNDGTDPINPRPLMAPHY